MLARWPVPAARAAARTPPGLPHSVPWPHRWRHRGPGAAAKQPGRCTFVTRLLHDNELFRLNNGTSCAALSFGTASPRMRAPGGLGAWEKTAVFRRCPGACQVRRTGTDRGPCRGSGHGDCRSLCCSACRLPLMPRRSGQQRGNRPRVRSGQRPRLGDRRVRVTAQGSRPGKSGRCGRPPGWRPSRARRP